jgi:hypothetical protein
MSFALENAPFGAVLVEVAAVYVSHPLERQRIHVSRETWA